MTWRERLGKERNAHWDDVIQKISPLASKDSLYLAAETEPDTYNRYEKLLYIKKAYISYMCTLFC